MGAPLLQALELPEPAASPALLLLGLLLLMPPPAPAPPPALPLALALGALLKLPVAPLLELAQALAAALWL